MSNVVVNDAHLYNIADAIRAKAGTEEKYTISEMSSAIDTLSVGGAELPTFTDGEYLFYGSGMNELIEQSGKNIKTCLTNANYLFYKNPIEEIPITINFDTTNYKGVDMSSMFSGSGIKTPPTITNAIPRNMKAMFSNCEYLEEIPEDFDNGFIAWYYKIGDSYYPTVYSASYMFSNCYRLKKVASNFINHNISDESNNEGIQYNYGVSKPQDRFQYGLFTNCYNLREVVGMDVFPTSYGDNWNGVNSFKDTFKGCYSLTRVTFIPNDRNVNGQSIDLTGIGYCVDGTIYTSVYLEDRVRVSSKTEYNQYKDTDYLATSAYYSQYNHDRAVETINSLPNTTGSGGTNTITFKGVSGTYTDGGAINTMTEEEIAVATAKGWTVSIYAY